jgi:hypothetical protein
MNLVELFQELKTLGIRLLSVDNTNIVYQQKNTLPLPEHVTMAIAKHRGALQDWLVYERQKQETRWKKDLEMEQRDE